MSEMSMSLQSFDNFHEFLFPLRERPRQESPQRTSPEVQKENRLFLLNALFHPENWPKGFVWNFERCETCAMGLYAALRGLNLYKLSKQFLMNEFGLSINQFHRVFLAGWRNTLKDVSSAEVCKRLLVIHEDIERAESKKTSLPLHFYYSEARLTAPAYLAYLGL